MAASPRITVIGDYSESRETHRATDAELEAAGVEFAWIPTTAIGDSPRALDGFDGLVIAPGTPYASTDGALKAVGHARRTGLPLIGMCGGFQYVVLEFVRSVLGLDDADHAETNPGAVTLAVTPLACSLVGQRHPVQLAPESRVSGIYGTDVAVEPFYCSYGVNPALEPQIEVAGLRISGRDAAGSARVIELDEHPFFIATLYVFQARSERTHLHPLTGAFLAAAGSSHGARVAR